MKGGIEFASCVGLNLAKLVDLKTGAGLLKGVPGGNTIRLLHPLFKFSLTRNRQPNTCVLQTVYRELLAGFNEMVSGVVKAARLNGWPNGVPIPNLQFRSFLTANHSAQFSANTRTAGLTRPFSLPSTNLVPALRQICNRESLLGTVKK